MDRPIECDVGPPPQVEGEIDDEARRRALHAARVRYQRGLLRVLRDEDLATGLTEMSQALREVGALVVARGQHAFWWSTQALVEALRAGDLELDLWVKRLFGRVDLQLRRLMEGSRSLDDCLLRDLLDLLAQADVAEGRAAEAHERSGLAARPLSAPEGTRDDEVPPRPATLRGLVHAAKRHWLELCGGRQDAVEPLLQAVASDQPGDCPCLTGDCPC